MLENIPFSFSLFAVWTHQTLPL